MFDEQMVFAMNKGNREDRKMMPTDPVILLSFINMKLRDYYGNLDALCEDMNISKSEIEEKLAAIDYHYNEERNQFV